MSVNKTKNQGFEAEPNRKPGENVISARTKTENEKITI